MTSISLEVPIVGQKNTTEEPKVGNSITKVQEYLNLTTPTVGVEGTNIVAASIKESNLEAAVVTKLNQKSSGLEIKKQTGSATGESGIIYLMETNAATLTLTATATAGKQVGIICANTIAGVKLKTGSGLIYGDFVAGLAEIPIQKYQHVIVEADGTNWWIISGEPKRQAVWEAFTLSKVEAEAAAAPSTFRPTLMVVTAEEANMVVESETVLLSTAAGLPVNASITFQLSPGFAWKGNKKCHLARLFL